MSSDVLFRPFKLKGLTLPNRVVMAPMTRSFSPGGIPTDDVAQYYRRRAEGAVGLIISEGTGVDRPAILERSECSPFSRREGVGGVAACGASFYTGRHTKAGTRNGARRPETVFFMGRNARSPHEVR